MGAGFKPLKGIRHPIIYRFDLKIPVFEIVPPFIETGQGKNGKPKSNRYKLTDGQFLCVAFHTFSANPPLQGP